MNIFTLCPFIGRLPSFGVHTCVVPEGKKEQPVEPEAGSVAYTGVPVALGSLRTGGAKEVLPREANKI